MDLSQNSYVGLKDIKRLYQLQKSMKSPIKAQTVEAAARVWPKFPNRIAARNIVNPDLDSVQTKEINTQCGSNASKKGFSAMFTLGNQSPVVLASTYNHGPIRADHELALTGQQTLYANQENPKDSVNSSKHDQQRLHTVNEDSKQKLDPNSQQSYISEHSVKNLKSAIVQQESSIKLSDYEASCKESQPVQFQQGNNIKVARFKPQYWKINRHQISPACNEDDSEQLSVDILNPKLISKVGSEADKFAIIFGSETLNQNDTPNQQIHTNDLLKQAFKLEKAI